MFQSVVLTWYQPKSIDSVLEIKSLGTKVELWYERGTRLYSKTLEPKLMWKTSSQKCLGSVQLMDISRVISLTDASIKCRNQYPFADPLYSFLVFTRSGGAHLFEAKSSHEKENEIHKLKVVVSNLISKLASGVPADLFFNSSPIKISGIDENESSREKILKKSVFLSKEQIPKLKLANELLWEEGYSD